MALHVLQKDRVQITPHFKRYELECPHCKTLPSQEFSDSLERMRMFYGKPIKPSSVYRCPTHNKAVGGSPSSAHILIDPGEGAIDIPIAQRSKTGRMGLIRAAILAGFDMIEIADRHLHFAITPYNHIMHGKLYTGFKSK